MFADIRGFPQLSGEVEPEVAMLVVNQIMQVLIRQVDAGGGIVNKFSGDGLLAVWNVPQAHPNHVGAAVAAAEAALREWASWSAGYPGVSDVQFAVGIDTGTAVAGIVGTEQRSEYTVIGDTVNLAARLCAAAPGGHSGSRTGWPRRCGSPPPWRTRGRRRSKVVPRPCECGRSTRHSQARRTSRRCGTSRPEKSGGRKRR